MIRPGATGSLLHNLRTAKPTLRTRIPPLTQTSRSSLRPSSLALTAYKPFTTSLQRYQTGNTIDIKHERAVGNSPLEPHPEAVSTVSSVHQVFHEQGVEEEDKGEDVLAGVKGDLVRTGFLLSAVPY